VTQGSEEVIHLERLAAELARHGLSAQVVTSGRQPCVKAANPNTPQLNERVLCDRGGDGAWCYRWPWQQPIGLVDDLQKVAGKITAVLRSVEGQS
jgi:hypothetical protein